MRSQHVFFAYSPLDIVPALMGLGQITFATLLFFGFRWLPWFVFLPLALVYAISIAWSLSSVSHNFIHNAFFSSASLNRIYSFLLSIANGFSQELYHHVHLRHHLGNMDWKNAQGTTIDPLSIYRHGKNGEAESPWTYALFGYFRDDIAEVYRRVKEKFPDKAAWIRREIVMVVALYALCALYDWRAFVALTPFYYLGHSLALLNGYYEHFKADPTTPLAWGVSTYERHYNWAWLNNGYHAEHHFRPKWHWTKMPQLHELLLEEQKRIGVRVIRWPHLLGFLDDAPAAGQGQPILQLIDQRHRMEWTK